MTDLGISNSWSYIDPRLGASLPAEMLIDYVRVYQEVSVTLSTVDRKGCPLLVQAPLPLWVVIQTTRRFTGHHKAAHRLHTILRVSRGQRDPNTV